MNNIICNKCNSQNNENAKFCSNCGNRLNVNVNEKDNGNLLGIISLLLFFGTVLCPLIILPVYNIDTLKNLFDTIIDIIMPIMPIAGIITMIIGRVKYPNNKLLKIVMWIIIVTIIVVIIMSILFTILLIITCKSILDYSCGDMENFGIIINNLFLVLK